LEEKGGGKSSKKDRNQKKKKPEAASKIRLSLPRRNGVILSSRGGEDSGGQEGKQAVLSGEGRCGTNLQKNTQPVRRRARGRRGILKRVAKES